jgi:hypothetical protein
VVIWLATIDLRYAALVVLGVLLLTVAIGGYRVWRDKPAGAEAIDARTLLLSDLHSLVHEGETYARNANDPSFGLPGRIEPAIGWTNRVYARLRRTDHALAQQFLHSSEFELVVTTDMFNNHNPRSIRERVACLREIVSELERAPT